MEHDTPTLLSHLQETVRNTEFAIKEALQKRGWQLPRKVGAQGEAVVPSEAVKAETEKHTPDPAADTRPSARQTFGESVMINRPKTSEETKE